MHDLWSYFKTYIILLTREDYFTYNYYQRSHESPLLISSLAVHATAVRSKDGNAPPPHLTTTRRDQTLRSQARRKPSEAEQYVERH